VVGAGDRTRTWEDLGDLSHDVALDKLRKAASAATAATTAATTAKAAATAAKARPTAPASAPAAAPASTRKHLAGRIK